MSHFNPGRWLSEQVAKIIGEAPVVENYTEGVELPIEPGEIESLKESRLPRVALEEMEGRRIFLSDRARSSRGAGRNPRSREITLQLLVVEKLNADHDGLEELIELMYAIDELIAAQTQLGWTGSENQPIYDPDALLTQNVFRSVLTFTFTSIS